MMTRAKPITEAERRAKFAACLADQMEKFERWAWAEFRTGKTHRRTLQAFFERDGFFHMENTTVEPRPIG